MTSVRRVQVITIVSLIVFILAIEVPTVHDDNGNPFSWVLMPFMTVPAPGAGLIPTTGTGENFNGTPPSTFIDMRERSDVSSAGITDIHGTIVLPSDAVNSGSSPETNKSVPVPEFLIPDIPVCLLIGLIFVIFYMKHKKT